MIHSRLISFFNKHTVIQGIFCILPIVFCITYFFAFLADYSNIYGSAMENNEVVESRTNSENLVEVSTCDKKEDKYETVITINEKYSIETNTSYIMGVYAVNNEWVKITIPNQDAVLVPVDSFSFLSDIDTNKESGVTFKIDGTNYDAYDTLLFKVYAISEESTSNHKYNLEIGNYIDTIEEEIKDLSYSSEKYIYHAKYSKVVEANDLAYCYNHFNDGKTYYDVRVNQCVKDLDNTVIKEFISQANLWLFLMAMIGYLLLLYYFYKRTDLKYINKKILVINTIGVLLIPLLFFIPSAIL